MNETQTQTAPRRGDEIEGVARDISAVARELAAEPELRRQLADELVGRLRDSGLLRAGAPVEVGGAELAPGPALRCAEEIARGDASAGWCVSIAITSSLLAAYLPAERRTELFGDGRGVAAGVWAPRGKARPLDDEVFVPDGCLFSLFDGPVLDRPLYRFPIFGFFALSIAAAALGNARAAIDELVALAAGKVGMGSARTLAERAPTQAAVAAAEASLRAARALYYEAIEAAWQAPQRDQPVPDALRN